MVSEVGKEPLFFEYNGEFSQVLGILCLLKENEEGCL